MIEHLSTDQIESFDKDGFLILPEFLPERTIAEAVARFDPLFMGQFETGLYPDEWNWRPGSPPDLTRQICNAWKSDLAIARIVLSEAVGQLCAQLAGWTGARLAQDNVIWKPPGAKPLGFHQDDSYNFWIEPGHMLTCWMALDSTSAAGGTIEYVRGSHRWPVSPPIGQFHAPQDYRRALMEAAGSIGLAPEIVPVEVPAGGCAFHDGRTWHGSDTNRSDRPRRSVIAHCMSSQARFHPERKSYIYNRYKKVNDCTMDESFFPVLWQRDGYRSAWLDAYAG